MLLIADYIVGGLFALNGGGFGQEELGHVFHLSADDTKWSSSSESAMGSLTGSAFALNPTCIGVKRGDGCDLRCALGQPLASMTSMAR